MNTSDQQPSSKERKSSLARDFGGAMLKGAAFGIGGFAAGMVMRWLFKKDDEPQVILVLDSADGEACE